MSVWRSRSTDYGTGWMVRGSNPGKGMRLFSSPKGLDRVWDPLTPLFSWYRLFLGGQAAGAWGWTLIYFVPMLGMSGAITLSFQYPFMVWAGITILFYSIQLVRKQYGYGLSHVFWGFCFSGVQEIFVVVLILQYKFTATIFIVAIFLNRETVQSVRRLSLQICYRFMPICVFLNRTLPSGMRHILIVLFGYLYRRNYTTWHTRKHVYI